MKKVWVVLVLFVSVLNLRAQDARSHWVDSVFQTLSPSQKIGQLFMLRTSPSAKNAIAEVKSFEPGGILISRGGPRAVVGWINELQKNSDVPLLFGLNAEWGLGQNLDSTMNFPKPIAQGSWPNDSLNFQLGQIVADQLKVIGVHVNFGPRLDRYDAQLEYGYYLTDNKERLLRKASAFVSGLQANGIIACPKLVDTKTSIPLFADSAVFYDASRLDTGVLFAPVQMMKQGANAFLTSHLNFFIIEKAGKKPVYAAMSPVVINNFLRKKTGYQGLLFTDIRTLLAISPKKKRGEIELLAFAAGNDILIAPQNPGAAIRRIQKAIKKNPLLMEQLNTSVKRILAAKFDAGLARHRFVDADNLIARLYSTKAHMLKRHLTEASIAVVENPNELVPIKSLEDQKFVSLSIGKPLRNEFTRYLLRYASIEESAYTSVADTASLRPVLDKASLIFVAVFPEGKKLESEVASYLSKKFRGKQIVVSHFGNPADLKNWDGLGTRIAAFDEADLECQITAQVIFGGLSASGLLPVTLSSATPTGTGVTTQTHDRFSYTLPEEAQMDSKTLDRIEAIAWEAVDNKATPGCRVFVARHGKVVYDKSFGHLTYDGKSLVTEETIYDLASITKVAATLQAVMFMQERGLIDINKKASAYLPELKKSDKKDFIIKDILTHQAGLWPFLPFWLQTMKDTVYLTEYYSRQVSADYPFPVSDGLFASKVIKDSLWQWIVNAKIVQKPERSPYTYRYSDMAFYIMQHIAEKLLNQPLEEFLEQNFYEPIGATSMGYLPLLRFPPSRIAPTENDKTFRKSLLTGYVHDQGAALYGGIAGHAGLFSNANDLAKMGQMWLQHGSYGGLQYFKPKTIDLFTQKQYENSRRGLGWDRPVHSDPDGPTSIYASQKTYGHTGFTGTCIWVDPEFDLVYVFLSNRVHPDMTNNKILNANIRPRIQDVIYKSIFNYCNDLN